jgi:hypothetical protein
MSAEAPRDSAKGLPVVVPPSGKFIAQLFLVPFLIVTLVVCFLITINWLVGGARSPKDFLDKLDSANPEVRWRGAEELAQYLQREEALAANPAFALELCERLQTAVKELASQEKELADFKKQQSDSSSLERKTKALQQTENYVLYLSSSIASSIIPVGAPLLGDMAANAGGVDPEASAQRRRWAMWNLAKLGDNVPRFDKLKPEHQEAIIAALNELAANPASSRAPLAEKARNYLRGPQAHSLQALGLEKDFTAAASDPDAFLRQLTALALSFWEGTPQENARIEELLLRLAHDDGHGENVVRGTEDETSREKAITKTPGLRTRFNAVLALAHRGSARTRLGVLQQMLDEPFLRDNFLIERTGGVQMPDEPMIQQTIEAALRALVQLHTRQPKLDLASFTPSLDTLAKNANIAIRTEAKRAQQALSGSE